MPQILNKGYTFGSTEQVTSTKLGNLVDNATFASTCVVGGGGLELSGGALQIANAIIPPTKLSSGAPSWDSGGNVNVGNTLEVGGPINTSNNCNVNGALTVNGTSTFIGNATFSGEIIRSGTSSNRTVKLTTGSTSPNAISFGYDNGNLLVTVGTTEFSIPMTPV